MDGINEEDIICIIPATPSSQQLGFTVHHLSPSEPIPRLSITQVPSTPPPNLFPYFLQLPHRFPSYLRLPTGNIHVLLSTKSGGGHAVLAWDQVVKPVLYSIGLKEESYRVLRTESHDSVREFAQDVLRVKAGEGAKQAVIVLSGDGGVVDLLNGVMSGERSRYVTCFLISLKADFS
jgi:hypothetical protein